MSTVEYALGTISVETTIRDAPDTKIETSTDVLATYSGLRERSKEHLYAVFLTNDNRTIGDKLIGIGSRDAVPVDVQDVVRTAALVNAAAVILVHNHYSANTDPTADDLEATQDLHDLLETLGVTLLDHVIIGRDDHHSMRAAGDGPF